MKGELYTYIVLVKSSTDHCHRSFNTFCTNNIEVGMICGKVACPASKILPILARDDKESPLIATLCLDKSSIQNLLSIRYLLNKLLQLVLVRVSMWRSNVMTVILIFQSLCQQNTFPLMLHHGCFLLMYVNKLLIKAQPNRNLWTPASAEMNIRGSLNRRLGHCLPNLLSFSLFLPISYPFRRLPAG